MALTFPLTLTQFWSLLPVADLTFDLPEVTTVSRTRGGEILQADRGVRLWQGQVTLDQITRDEAARVLPLINLLRAAGRSFLITDLMREYPAARLTGATLGTTVQRLASVATNAREITLSGLPPGYPLVRGDLLSFSYGNSPARYALHEIVTEQAVADGSGVTPVLEVVPPIRAGAAVDTRVYLARPTCKAIIEPGSFEPGRRRPGGLREGVTFRWKQTLR